MWLMVNIIIADDHGLLRAGLRALLVAEPDMYVVGEAADGQTALLLVEELRPDVLLADISMPGPDGIEVARSVQRDTPGTRVLIVSMHEDPGLVLEAIAAGAAGYLSKRSAEAELINAVRTVVGGNLFLPPTLAAQAAPVPLHQHIEASVDLAPTERELVHLMAHGYSNGQIGQALALSTYELGCVRAELSKRLDLYTRADFVRFASKHGLL
jgi:DNA-binding NarL/FixJ family response regulator